MEGKLRYVTIWYIAWILLECCVYEISNQLTCMHVHINVYYYFHINCLLCNSSSKHGQKVQKPNCFLLFVYIFQIQMYISIWFYIFEWDTESASLSILQKHFERLNFWIKYLVLFCRLLKHFELVAESACTVRAVPEYLGESEYHSLLYPHPQKKINKLPFHPSQIIFTRLTITD